MASRPFPRPRAISLRVGAGLLLAAACSLDPASSGDPPLPVRATDTLLEVEGASPEVPARFAFVLDEPRHVTIRSFLSPVRVRWEVRNGAGAKVSTRGRPLLPAGTYTLALTPGAAVEEPLLLEILTAPQRDRTESASAASSTNDAPARSLAVAPDTAVYLSRTPEQTRHWFEVEIDREGVLLARLEGGTGARVELWSVGTGNGEGATEPRSLAQAPGEHTAFVHVSPGLYRVAVLGDGPSNPAPGAVLRIMHRTPDERPAGGVGIMTIGMDPQTAAQSSLGRIAEATGLPLVSTQSADDILWVLATAIGAEIGTDPRWALPAFLGSTALLFGLARGLRRLVRRSLEDPLPGLAHDGERAP